MCLNTTLESPDMMLNQPSEKMKTTLQAEDISSLQRNLVCTPVMLTCQAEAAKEPCSDKA